MSQVSEHKIAAAGSVQEEHVLNALWRHALPHLSDRQRLMEEIGQSLPDLLHVSSLELLLLDADGTSLRTAAAWPTTDSPDRQIALGEGICGHVAQTGEQLAVSDLSQEPRYTGTVPDGAQAALAIPLATSERVVGVLLLTRPTQDGFAEPDKRAILIASEQITFLIDYALRYSELEVRNQASTTQLEKQNRFLRAERDRVDFLYKVTREMTRTLELEVVLNRTLARVSQALGVRQGSILLLDPESGYLLYRAAIGRAEALPRGGKPTHFRRGVGLAGWVLEHNKHAIVTGLDDDPRWDVDPEQRGKSQSVLAVPLSSGDEVLGVIMLFHPEPSYFSPDHIVLASAAANHITAAIKNAEMYRLVLDQATRLGDMLRQQRHVSSQYTAILAAITDGVAVSDENERLTVVNDAARRILHLGSERLIGSAPSVLFSSFPRTQQQVALDSLVELTTRAKRRQSVAPVAVLLHRDSQVVQASFMPMRDERQVFAGIVLVLRDVTREQEIAQAKNEFVSIVAHELRTPMTSIKGYTDLILQGAVGEVNDGQRHFLDIVKSNVDRLSELVSDLLDTARIDAGRIKLEPEQVQIADIVHEVCDSIAETLRERELSLTIDEAPSVPIISADRNRAIQILTNLLSNAYRYTPSGGEITISVQATDDAVQVTISDTGIGIPAEDHDRIFEPFYRSNQELVNQQPGTGLGLSIVKSLVEMHGGYIELESELGKGSTFTFVLPIERGQPHRDHSAT